MAKLFNRAKVSTSTTGTGTVTLGSATTAAFCTFAEAGVSNGDTVSYLLEEGTDFEIGTGVYTSSGTTLSRATVTLSKIAGTSGTSKMNLAGAATVTIVARQEDLLSVSNTQIANQIYAGPSSGSAAAPAFRAAVAADLPTGCVLQCLQNTYATNTNLTTTLPFDNTTPQSTEGVQVLSQAITPGKNTNKILCLVKAWGSPSSGESTALVAALFRGSTCIDAVAFNNTGAIAQDDIFCLSMMYLDSPATTSSTTYSVRAGNNGNSQFCALNGSTSGGSGRKFGGTAVCTLTVMEIAA